MIGTVEFNSATLYRFATIDVDQLRTNLGDGPAVRRAVEAFLRAFITSMPTGKQNTFANRTLPDAVLVKIRETQPINFVGAFEEPVSGGQTIGRLQEAASRLAEYAEDVEAAYGEHAVRSLLVRVGDRTKKLEECGGAGDPGRAGRGSGARTSATGRVRRHDRLAGTSAGWSVAVVGWA